MLRGETKYAVVHVDPISINADVIVLSGNPTQVYNRETKEYVSDRNLVPLIATIHVNVIDPEGIMSGQRSLTGIAWYEGAPLADGSNRITSSTAGYEIGDGTVTGFPKFAIKCKKNIPTDAPVELHAVASFTDVRRNIEVQKHTSLKVYTTYYDKLMYTLKMNVPAQWIVDPLQIVSDKDGSWPVSFGVQLYSGKDEVPDNEAAYWWKIEEYKEGKWVAVTKDDLETWITCRDSQGNWTKTVTLDARMLTMLRFTAQADHYTGTRPQAPSQGELFAETAVCMEMPRSIHVDCRMTKGCKQTSRFDQTVGYEAILSYCNGIITNKDELFKIEWKGKSGKPGSNTVSLGFGKTIEFVPSQKGFDKNYPVSVWPEVKLYDGHALVVNNGTPMGHNGQAIIVKTYI